MSVAAGTRRSAGEIGVESFGGGVERDRRGLVRSDRTFFVSHCPIEVLGFDLTALLRSVNSVSFASLLEHIFGIHFVRRCLSSIMSRMVKIEEH